MVAAYLYLNALLYAAFALLCAINLGGTSKALGYTALTNSGLSEYFTVYGGLQWGLALIFAWLAWKPELHRTGLILAILFYAPLVLHRLVSLARFGPVEKMTLGVAALEAALLVLPLVLWFFARPVDGR